MIWKWLKKPRKAPMRSAEPRIPAAVPWRFERRGALKRNARRAILIKAVFVPMALLALASTETATSLAQAGNCRAKDRFDGLILAHSQRARLNPRYVKAIVAAESEFEPRAVSPRGARGLMQVMPATGEEMGIPRARLHDPHANLRAGTAYLNRLFQAARLGYGLKADRLQDAPPWVQRRVLAAYNGGPRLLFRNDWPRQTRCYVRKVMRYCGSRAADIRTSAA